ncbi:MAG: NDP-sugar synthase [Candidatus Lokiarchaeota archaeon]|nr:NDP-sugar synthase [Candidatus Lokiarchaeota archaeon]
MELDVSEWSAVVLAGGLGTRLLPLTANICKPMVKVCNRAMVDYCIDHLRFAGINKIVVCVKHMGDELREYLWNQWDPIIKSNPAFTLEIPKNDSYGTADAVRKVWDLIQTDNFIVSMADIVTNLPLKEFMKFHTEKHAEATVSMKPIDEFASKYGNTVLNADGRVKLFLEKPSAHEIFISSLTQQRDMVLPTINTGIYCFQRDIAQQVIMETEFNDFGKEIFPYLLENNYKLFGFNEQYYWMDVGNPKTYLWANWDILREYGWPILPQGEDSGKKIWTQESLSLPYNSYLHDRVCLGKNIHFGENVRINSLTVLGDNVVIGNNSLIDRSVVWHDVTIGQNCIIEQSVIANGCKIGNNVTIRSESMIGPHAVIEDDAVLDSRTVQSNENVKKEIKG